MEKTSEGLSINFIEYLNLALYSYYLFLFSISGTPEVGGLTTIQALELVWGCRGLNLVGGDLVEVSDIYVLGFEVVKGNS